MKKTSLMRDFQLKNVRYYKNPNTDLVFKAEFSYYGGLNWKIIQIGILF